MTDKVAVQHDAEQTRRGLEAWFSDKGTPHPSVTILPGPELTGYSHETIIFELASNGATQKLVARVEPQLRSIFPDPDLDTEYRLLEKISDEPIPLPKLHGYEPSPEYLGTPFYVMDHVEGRVPQEVYPMAGWLHDATPDERAHVWWSGLTELTKPHLVDWEGKGLEFVNGGRSPGLGGELEYWSAYVDFVGRPVHPAAERALRYLLRERPSGTKLALCWGDSRLGNQMFRDGRCVALLDWEMACVSDPIQDLAWFVHFDDLFSDGLGVARLEGIPPRSETIARYEDLTGFDAQNFDYYEVFAAFRFTVILQRLGNLQVETGAQPPDSMFPIDNFASQNLQRLVDEKGLP